MNLMNNFYAKVMNMVDGLKKDERGSQTLEWIGIAAVIVIVVGLVSTAFDGSKFGDTVVKKFEGFLSKIGSGE